MLRPLVSALSALLFILPASAKFSIDKIEPPHWWTGLKNGTLQLQVHGAGVKPAEVSLKPYPGVTLDSVARLDGSDNWQYLYLGISPEAKPGTLTLVWKEGKQKVERKYSLLPRREKPGAAGFNSADVLYMIMPDRFADGNPANNLVKEMNHPVGADRSNLNVRHGGDLKGIADHLDYIDSLGVTTIWLNPVLENDMPGGSYHGYATTDYYNVDRRLGTNAEYAALVDSLHNRGMKIVMDMIFNHSGSGHPWFLDPPASDWFNHQAEGFTPTNHKLSAITDPYASEFDKDRAVNGWFVEEMPDLNQLNPHLMKYLVQNSIFWIEEVGIDAIRMDTYPYADRDKMGEWVEELYAEYPDFTIVGECWFAEPAIESTWQTGAPLATAKGDPKLDVVMDFALMMKSRNLAPFTAETNPWSGLSEIYNHLGLDYIYGDPNKVLRFLDNHDTERVILEVPENLDAWKQAVTLLLTIPGIPQLYYGTELLMAGDRKPGDGNVRRDVPGGFPGDVTDNFTAAGRSELQNEAYDFIANLLKWRKGNKAVSEGSMKHFVPYEGVYTYVRETPDRKVVVMMNGRDEEVDLELAPIRESVPRGMYWDILSNSMKRLDGETLHFQPREILILDRNKQSK